MASMRVNKAGMAILHRIKGYLKPTTNAIQIFGQTAKKNVLDIGRDVLLNLLEKRTVMMAWSDEEGYVILRYEGIILGCGLALKDRLMHQLPRWMVQNLLAALSADNRSLK